MIRTGLAASAVVFALGGATAEAENPLPLVSVSKTSGCGCCSAWIEHLEQNGFAVESRDLASGEMIRFKLENGIGQPLMSCHTAKVEGYKGYTIEGHVPAEDIRRLLDERPEAVGLAVPGMPLGSPGMDVGEETEPYDVLLVGRDGDSEVFSSYPAE